MKTRRSQRLRKLLDLVGTLELHTQEEVAAALDAAGWQATQSSVSRDIAALHLTKIDGVYRRPERHRKALGGNEQAVAESVLSYAPAGDSLVILHTPPGEANRVGLALDRLGWTEVVGTIAGDDTLFVAVRDSAAQRQVLAAFAHLIEGDDPA